MALRRGLTHLVASGLVHSGIPGWAERLGAELRARLAWGRLLLEELCNRPSFHRSFASTAEQATVMMWHIR